MGGAPPHKNNLIGRSLQWAYWNQSVKIDNSSFLVSLLFTCSLADEPEAGRAGWTTALPSG